VSSVRWALPRRLDDEHWEVARLDGSRRLVVALDPEDAHLVEGVRWHPNAYGYLVRDVKRPGVKRSVLFLHRLVHGATPGMEVDHEDRNRLNNRRDNLRPTTASGQRQNTSALGGSSAYRGVSWYARHGRWMARYGRKQFIGYFDDEREAALAVWRWRVENLPLCRNEPCPV
jgi:hypothetical protein